MKTAMCCGKSGAMVAPAVQNRTPVTETELVENLRSATTKLAKASVSLPSSLSLPTATEREVVENIHPNQVREFAVPTPYYEKGAH
jgi:hypothetical protein